MMVKANPFAKPVYYLAAFGLPADFDKVTSADVKKAYASIASNGAHPDNGGDPQTFALVTAAYNELKAIFGKKRGVYENKSDVVWMRNWTELHAPKPQPKADKPKSAPKTDAPKTDAPVWVFEEREGESKDDRRKRYARERQAFRYANDPEFAKARKEASKRSHSKKN